jgi:hypothetical protein
MGANHAVASAQDPNVEVKPIDLNTVPGAAPAPGTTSDAVRYQILLKHGGCYLDNDVEPGDPMPSLTVSPDSALFAPASPGGPRESAIACVIGSHRIQQLIQAVAVQPKAEAPAVALSSDDLGVVQYVRGTNCFRVKQMSSVNGQC